MDTVCIQTADLTKRFGSRPAVQDVDLQVEKGQTFGFLGPNGAGKSTTIRMMLGLVSPTLGNVRIFGHDVQSDRLKALAHVGAMVETPAFYPFLSGRDNVTLFGKLSGPVTKDQVNDSLNTVGLLNRAKDRAKTYSHGMKQRLGIACALVSNPELVILDEPTNGLDPEGVKEVRMLIRSLAQERGITVFLSSHLLHEVEQVCSHVGIISKGKLVTIGSVESLLGGGDNPVEFEVDNPEAASAVLEKQMGLPLFWLNEKRFVVQTDSRDCAELNRILVNAGVGVYAIERRQTSLEDFYLELMSSEETRN